MRLLLTHKGVQCFLSMINTDKKSDDGQYFIKDILYLKKLYKAYLECKNRTIGFNHEFKKASK